ncbi:MAG: SurA N-terminal domain-containing protein [Pseudomonadota bacterium]
MFEFVRTHTRLLQLILALLIFPSFVLFGVQGYNSYMEAGNAPVAKVDGQAITQAEWDAAHQRQIERVRAQMPGIDVKLFDTPEMKQQTLEQLVRERVLFSAAEKLHLQPSDDRLAQALLTMPELAQLRGPDGKFDKARYEQLLSAQGMTPAIFEARLRQDLALRQVLGGISDTVVAPGSVSKAALDALLQKREIQLQRFDTKDYLSKVNPTDAEIEAYYKAHEAQFRAPEQASIEYVVLDLDTLMKGITVPEKDLREYYEQNKSRYGTPEERHAAHILVKAEKDAPAAERTKAKARAEELLAEVRKNPGAFAELAKKHSEDPGSREQGGDLGFFGREAMVKPFSDAAFALKPGEISNVVESDFGYHVIKLIEVRGGEVKPFEAVRASIEDDVKKQLAQRKYAEAAEQFSNTVYEQPDSLQPVIDKLKLEKKTATVQHATLPPGNGPLSSAKFIEAVFSAEAVRNKRNTEAVEVGPNQLASGRVVQHTPAHTRPLAQVKDQVRERVAAEQAAALARKDGEARLAQLRQGGDASALGAPVVVSRARADNVPRQVVEAALKADAAKLPALLGVDLGDQGYAVVRLTKVEAPDPASEEMKGLQPRYAQAWANAESEAYLEALKRRYKAEVKVQTANAAPAADGAAAR